MPKCPQALHLPPTHEGPQPGSWHLFQSFLCACIFVRESLYTVPFHVFSYLSLSGKHGCSMSGFNVGASWRFGAPELRASPEPKPVRKGQTTEVSWQFTSKRDKKKSFNKTKNEELNTKHSQPLLSKHLAGILICAPDKTSKDISLTYL